MVPTPLAFRNNSGLRSLDLLVQNTGWIKVWLIDNHTVKVITDWLSVGVFLPFVVEKVVHGIFVIRRFRILFRPRQAGDIQLEVLLIFYTSSLVKWSV